MKYVSYVTVINWYLFDLYWNATKLLSGPHSIHAYIISLTTKINKFWPSSLATRHAGKEALIQSNKDSPLSGDGWEHSLASHRMRAAITCENKPDVTSILHCFACFEQAIKHSFDTDAALIGRQNFRSYLAIRCADKKKTVVL